MPSLNNTFPDFLRIISFVSLSFLFIYCSSINRHGNEYISILGSTENNGTTKSVVIMPFENESTEYGMEILTRKSFYNYFSSKNYYDFELNEIDRGLEIIKKDSSSSWKEIPSADILKFFQDIIQFIIRNILKEIF